MATILQQYRDMQSNLKERMSSDQFTIDQILVLQELSYRISVIETFEIYCKTAPVTSNLMEMAIHYQLVDAHIQYTMTERRFGFKANDKVKKQRETVISTFENIVQDGRKRFSSISNGVPDQYKNDINSYIRVILPVWLQYRNCYINIAMQ